MRARIIAQLELSLDTLGRESFPQTFFPLQYMVLGNIGGHRARPRNQVAAEPPASADDGPRCRILKP
jgi:hypothetical protein